MSPGFAILQQKPRTDFMRNNEAHHSKRFTRRVHFTLILCAGLALAAVQSGCGQRSSSSPSAPDDPAVPSAEHGQQLFIRSCAACHGPQGQGIPHLGKDLQTSKFVEGSSDAQLVDFIIQGRAADDPLNTSHVAMPPKGGNSALTTQDLRDIVAYIRQLQNQSGTAK
jgi:mono/diheme cytochrome c family protein